MRLKQDLLSLRSSKKHLSEIHRRGRSEWEAGLRACQSGLPSDLSRVSRRRRTSSGRQLKTAASPPTSTPPRGTTRATGTTRTTGTTRATGPTRDSRPCGAIRATGATAASTNPTTTFFLSSAHLMEEMYY